MLRKLIVLFLLAQCCLSISHAQQTSNGHVYNLRQAKDTVLLDSLHLIPRSVWVLDSSGRIVDTALYEVVYSKSLLILHDKSYWSGNGNWQVHYRTFPFSLTKVYQHKSLQTYTNATRPFYNPFALNNESEKSNSLRFDGLNKQGSISRGISFGNSQDVVVNSSLNLQLSGKLGNDIEVQAAITDENIPFQPQGNTQQLQDFDKVFIQFTRKQSQLRVGDFELKRPNSYFSTYYKKAQGINFASTTNINNRISNFVSVAGAIARGKLARNVKQGIEGNQGPYRLTGNNNETFIIVISGSERVYIDGQLLVRGLKNDYVIDYNTGEITFTPKRLITKDSRIVVEFEYSDKNYSRSIVAFNDELSTPRLKLRFNLYSEQDAKNQPILQNLSDTMKAKLSSVGDSLQKAVVPSIDSVAFTTDIPLYKKLDTIYQQAHYTIYQYSTSKDSAHYRISFSNVGDHKGSYALATSAANGKVFRWVGPQNGTYEPIVQLIAPKQQQLFTLGGQYQLNKNTQVMTEVALSNYNQNLFSEKDKADDMGYAVKMGINNRKRLGGDSTKAWTLASTASLEHTDYRFKAIEKYRPIEFERDWNISTTNLKPLDENIAQAGLELSKKEFGAISYQLKTFNRGSFYTGLLQSLNAINTWKGFKLITNNSYLSTNSTDTRSSFLRQKIDLSKGIYKFVLGIAQEQELNTFRNPATDTLLHNSYHFYTWKAYVATADSLKNKFRLEYSQRHDFLALNNQYELGTIARNLTATGELNTGGKSKLIVTSTFRTLEVVHTVSGQQPQNSLINRLEYNWALWKGAISNTTFYEIGTGQEEKKDYSFLEVARGKGNYIWIDENGNGIKERNEYRPAIASDTAKYVKVLLPTNEYKSIHNSDFNNVLNINPSVLWVSAKGWKGVAGHFANTLALQVSRKTEKGSIQDFNYINPFSQSIADTSVIATNAQIRNTLFFNRGRGKIGGDVSILSTQNKSYLVGGFDTRSLNEKLLNIRWDISPLFNYTTALKTGLKHSYSDQFINNRFDIDYQELEPKLNYQPNNTIRLVAGYKYTQKSNRVSVVDTLGAKTKMHKLSLEFKYSTVKVGNVQLRVGWIDVTYTASDAGTLAYEMLEGLRSGQNITWGLSLQRNLSNNTQLSITYDARKSEGANTIHTGGAQLRAYF